MVKDTNNGGSGFLGKIYLKNYLIITKYFVQQGQKQLQQLKNNVI